MELQVSCIHTYCIPDIMYVHLVWLQKLVCDRGQKLAEIKCPDSGRKKVRKTENVMGRLG